MKPVSTPLPNLSHIGLLLLASLALVVGCKGGSSGGRIERVCEDYCHTLEVECADIPDAEDLCIDACVDDVEMARELDGKACEDAQLDAFACVADQVCIDVFAFTDLRLSRLPTSYCTAEIDAAVALCVESIDLPN